MSNKNSNDKSFKTPQDVTDTSLVKRWAVPGAGETEWYISAINADEAWLDYSGRGVIVGVVDDGFDLFHSDLDGNYRVDLDYDFADGDSVALPVLGNDDHGTAVMGLIGAESNGAGMAGVAYEADLVGYRISFGASFEANVADAFFNAASVVDVVNGSWGWSEPFYDDVDNAALANIFNNMERLVSIGRGGLGSSITIAAGNSRAVGDSVTYHGIGNSPYTIAVAATDSSGVAASFSNPGSALLVSAPGEDILSTDRTGADGYGAGDYTLFGGTSGATPVVAGVVSLMLEANPNLGYRDVQEILAYSAQHNDPTNANWQYNGADNWNGGGLHHSIDYGFGLVDARSAVRLAETWDLQQTFGNLQSVSASASPNLNIPDLGTASTNMVIAQDIVIEHVLVTLDIDHTWVGDLKITLTSPDGTQSILADRPGLGGVSGGVDFQFSSTAHWGEHSIGTWTIGFEDLAAGDSGPLVSWSLEFLGRMSGADDLYVFTEDFGRFSGAELAARNTIDDSDGGIDTLNLAAVISDTLLDMTPGGAGGTIAGNTVTINAGALIENIYTGDGDDTITGNDANNIIYGGRGADTLSGALGNDTLKGDKGNDTLSGNAGIDTLNGGSGTDTADYSMAAAGVVLDLSLGVATDDGDGANDVLVNIEDIIGSAFADSILGNDVDNTLSGGDGADDLRAGKGRDVVYGGAGSDYILGQGSHDIVFGDDDNDQIYGNAGDDILYGGNGNDKGMGGSGNDTLYGNAGNDFLRGHADNDTLYGGDGVDRLDGDDGADLAYGGNGDDKLLGDQGSDELHGGNDNDKIYGGDNADSLYGDTGDDLLKGQNGNDTLYGGDGIDRLYGDAGNDELHGELGNDELRGGDGIDTMYGGDGNDFLRGGSGADILYGDSNNDDLHGEADNDVLYGGGGADRLFGEDGDDTLNGGNGDDNLYGDAGQDVLNGDAGNDLLRGHDGNDTMHGGNDADTLYGDAGNDFLYGDAGNDKLYGNAGNDRLYGGSGNDKVYSDAGSDRMTGNQGADDFIWRGSEIVFGVDNDTVYDFDPDENDQLRLDDVLTGFDPVSDLVSDFVRITNDGTDSFLAVDVDGGGNNFVQIATLLNVTGLNDEQGLFDGGILVIT